ncbi:Homeobox transcription [Mycena indigotica]|uniref:Homeobox transcription n=1 Tax=Mycena indigotica TaxID=2126181 RepID=A0A8H6WL39_9AGAR|nr:Homeobox transcription [Mycena indigotica]KAF7316419.1 Homeobox transcription [Mycena indigotica]
MAASPRPEKERDEPRADEAERSEEQEKTEEKEEQEREEKPRATAPTEETVSPTDNVLKIKSRAPHEHQPLPPQPPAPQLYSPPYNVQPQWPTRPADQPWMPPTDPGAHRAYGIYPEQDPHQSVRLPSIQALLTEPFNPPPRGPVYSDRQDWPHQQQPMPIALPPAQTAPERYPPVVAPLPLDDSRARSPQAMPQRKRGRLPKETTDFLKAWLHSHSAHPYPSEIEKKQMCHATGLSMSQVSNWMINGRRRILGPSYLSTSRSNPHTSPPVTLSAPSMNMNPAPVLLTAPSMMLRSPTGPPHGP